MNAADCDARLDRIADFLEDHLDDEIDLHELAERSRLSPYHWHRIYRARRGETILATLERLRLHRAGSCLTETAMPLDDIAERAGFRSTPAFARAFERQYGLAPARYRQRGRHSGFEHQPNGDVSLLAYPVSIERRPAATAITIEHRGSYLEVGRAFDALDGWLDARRLSRDGSRPLALFYDDPALGKEIELQSRAGLLLTARPEVEWPLEETLIAGREYAVLDFEGPRTALNDAYAFLYGGWLMDAGREPANEPVFEEYSQDPRAAGDLVTRICLPLL